MTDSGGVVLAGKHEIVEGNTNLNRDGTASLAEPPSVLARKPKFAALAKLLFCSCRNPPLSPPAPPESSTVTVHSSTRMERMMQLRTECATELEFEIKASKDHWTEQSTSVSQQSAHGGSTYPEVSSDQERQKNAEIVESLRRQWPRTRQFFMVSDALKIGAKIAEGGQAEIFEAESNSVLKVFKEGTTLRDLRRQLPPGMLRHTKDMYASPHFATIYRGTVVMNGRFAFQMFRYWGDLRKLIDLRMQHNPNLPPFGQEEELEENMKRIAEGMKSLHKDKIIHRDLKASNVLVYYPSHRWQENVEFIYSSRLYETHVADYECSVGVVGTGFWRAPEILRATKDYKVKENLFSEKSDVYSYAMTCYELISGQIPFEDVARNDYDVVLRGERPSLPHETKLWIKDLLSRCWHPNPKKRPSFKDVVKCFEYRSN